MKILGISAFYHDSAAALIEDGEIVAAAQEERFTRLKHDKSFPLQAIKFCLKEAKLEIHEIDAIVFYDKPFLKFERIIQTYMTNAPKGYWQFVSAIPAWLKEKLFIKKQLKNELEKIGKIDWKKTSLLFSKHHLSHAASSFFTSPFEDAAILTIDGVGEWATATISQGRSNRIQTLNELHFPDSLGLFYSAFTYFLGFKVNEGEYKVMGLAPYADRNSTLVKSFIEKIKKEIITIFDDGSIQLNQQYFKYSTSFKMINEKAFQKLFNIDRREVDTPINEKHYCLAAALQIIVEEVVLKMALEAKRLTKSNNLCLSGGVALNCVANGFLKEQGVFENIYVQPAAGDAGAALGAALACYHMYYNKKRKIVFPDAMKNSRLGPSFTDKEIEQELIKYQLSFKKVNKEELIKFVSIQLSEGKVVAWFQGKMEFGPRALGGRSILGNPLLKETQSKLNLKVKKRESFRPFAPIMPEEEFEKYFGGNYSSPYMLMVHKIKPEYRQFQNENAEDIITKINQVRSVLPAITHIDFSSRIQTVNQTSDRLMYDLLIAFKAKTKFGILVNTSFNIKDEPIVCTPEDAINCFKNNEIDTLVIGNYITLKN